MEINPIIKKLRIKEGMACGIFNAPDNVLPLFESLPFGAVWISEAALPLDFAIIFFKQAADIGGLMEFVLARLKVNALLWLAFPKMKSGFDTDLNRDILWSLVEPYGLRAVTNIAVDDIWSALRFMPIKE